MIIVPGVPNLPDEFGDFRRFLYLCWKFLNLPIPTLVQLDIAHYLQHGPRRKIIEAFRGVGKSWITSAYGCWRLRLDPQLNILVVSASKDRADAFSTFTQRLIYEMPVLQCLIPKHGQRESKVAFDVGPAEPDHSPSVKSVGIFGQLTGTRADLIIPDDIEVPNNSQTQGMRDKLSEAIKEFDAILKPGGEVGYLGTPQCEDTVYDALPERGYTKRIWPARYPAAKDVIAYGRALAPLIAKRLEDGKAAVGEPTDPQRFNEIDLMEREASYGRSGFALQYMLNTSLADADRHPLKLSDLIVMGLNPDMAPEKVIWGKDPRTLLEDMETVGLRGDRYYGPAWLSTQTDWVKFQGCVMAIDPSGRGKDETSYAVVAMVNGQLFLLAAGGYRGGYREDTLKGLARIAKVNRVNKIVIESNFGDGMFGQLLKPVLKVEYPCTTEEVRHNIQKEMRIIDTLEPVMNQHKLVVCRSVIEDDFKAAQDLPSEQRLKYQLFYQMSRITKDRGSLAHDDRLDALSIAVNYWVERMGQDVDDQVEKRKDELLQRELDVLAGGINMPLDSLILGTPVHAGGGNLLRHKR